MFPEHILQLICDHLPYYSRINFCRVFPYLKNNYQPLTFHDLLGERLAGFMSYKEFASLASNELQETILNYYDDDDRDWIRDILILFLGTGPHWNYAILVSSNHYSYHSWQDDWYLFDGNPLRHLIDLNSTYKSIGERINQIEFNKITTSANIHDRFVEYDRHFRDAVIRSGRGRRFHPRDTRYRPWKLRAAKRRAYRGGKVNLMKIKTNTKILQVGIDGSDCYYPKSIWKFL